MNGYRFHYRLATALLLAAGLFLFAGCQALKGDAQGTVQLGTSELDFGTVILGTSATLGDTITNNTTSAVTIASIQGLTSEFQVTGLTLPATLAAGQAISFGVVFQPTDLGDPTITISFDSPNSQAIVSLPTTGIGATVGKLVPNPSQIIFGNVVAGSTQSSTVALSNSGGTTLTLTSATLSGAGFTLSNLPLPMTLQPGGATSATITFAPPSKGNFSGSITFATTAAGLNSSVIFNLAGAGVAPGILTPTASSLAFGSIQVGTKSTLSETLTNTGTISVTITQATPSGTGFSVSGLTLPVTLAANQAVSFNATFAPTSAGAASGSLSVVSNASNSPLSIPLSGTALAAGALSASPSSANFGNVTDGSNQTVPVIVTNTGGESVTISSAAASGTGFSFTGQTPPLTLTAGQSATFNAVFTPTAAGAATGSLTINSNAINPTLSIPLSGTGVAPGQLGSNPSSFAFGNIQDGTSKSLSGTLTNSGGTTITISAASASGTGFSLSGLSLPVTLAAGQSTSFSVLFSPTAAGAASGSVSVTSNASNTNLSIPLTGTGVTQGTLAANPTSLPFGNVQDGSSTTLSETLTNTGGSSLTISAASASGTGFSLSGLTLPVTLTAGQSTSFSVKFSPTAAGAASGSISVTSNGSNPSLSIPLSGTGVTQGTLTASPTILAFGNVQDGSNTTLSETLTNTGGSSLTISAASAGGTGFSLSGLTLPLTLVAGQSTSFSVKFAPTSAGAASGSISITSNGSNSSLSIPLSGTGVAPGTLTATPTSLAFGSVQVGNRTNLSETLTNTGGPTVTISAANLSGAGFSLTGLTLPASLNTNQSVTFTATFTPTTAGAASGSISVVSTASNSPLTIALSGTGTTAGTLAVSPATLAFGNVNVGSSSALGASLIASGAAVTVNSASSNSSEFVLSGISLPVTIPAGQSSAFTVTFTPQSSGAASASLSFSSNASNSPAVQSLTGTGTTQTQHTVDLTWNSSAEAVGYNIYRGTVSGGPYSMINSSLDSSTAYTDSTVTSGTTYYYVATAVNSSSEESGYSNQATAVIPNP